MDDEEFKTKVRDYIRNNLSFEITDIGHKTFYSGRELVFKVTLEGVPICVQKVTLEESTYNDW